MSEFKHLNEANTCARLITPAIHKAGFLLDELDREYKITDGQIREEKEDGTAYRKNPLFADYVLRYKDFLLAVVEAKKTSNSVRAGLYQAQTYA